jgi:hypothetical protein
MSNQQDHIPHFGIITIGNAHCACGHAIEPHDFRRINARILRGVCPKCHDDLIELILDRPQAREE